MKKKDKRKGGKKKTRNDSDMKWRRSKGIKDRDEKCVNLTK